MPNFSVNYDSLPVFEVEVGVVGVCFAICDIIHGNQI